MNENKKIEFIKDEMWMLTINAICRGTKLYNNHAKKEDKEKFKKELKKHVNNIVEDQYHTEVEEKKHLKNIEYICEIVTEEYSDILKEEKLLMGRAQKLLNLYLKYLWCLEIIEEPPHCPIDRKIIKEVESGSNITSWTKMKRVDVYVELIEKIRKKANEESVSIAQWELEKYSRK